MKAALTPEEWARWSELEADNELIDEESGHSPFVQMWNVEGPNEHACAALLLHGQPFGFTREDVRLLRATAEEFFETADIYGCAGAPELRLLADRIEALLPPEEA